MTIRYVVDIDHNAKTVYAPRWVSSETVLLQMTPAVLQPTALATGKTQSEPLRVCQRPFGLPWQVVPTWRSSVPQLRRRDVPMGSKSRRLLNQSTHSSVANSTASNDRHGPRRWMIRPWGII
jgi:hypothetical protein